MRNNLDITNAKLENCSTPNIPSEQAIKIK